MKSRGMKCFLAVLITTMCFKSSSGIAPLAHTPLVIYYAQRSREQQRPLSKGTGSSYTLRQPLSCESFGAVLDDLIIKWHEMKLTYFIVIDHLGESERSSKLGRNRLKEVETYLERHNVKYIVAEGARVEGLGMVEIYLGGKLGAAIPIEKNAKGVCSGKLNPFL